jgi:hypothetical protein
MKHILVVANETVGGTALIDAVKRRAEGGEVKVTVICPQNDPRGGWVIYDDAARGAADNRLQTTLAQLREVGIQADGEIMDPDPYAATMDAIDAFKPDEVVISTHPETRSGWMRKDLPSRIEEDSGLPVEHVVVDLDAEREDVVRTLVVANQTVDSEPLHERIVEKSREGNHQFTLVVPASGGSGDPHERLAHMLKRLADEGIQAVGQVGHPDPFTAIQNAMQYYAVDDILISTFEGERSGWLRANLIERIKAATSRPVEHIVASREKVES